MSLSHFVVDCRRDKVIMESLKDAEIPTSQSFKKQIHDYTEIMESEEIPQETPEEVEDTDVFQSNSALKKLKVFEGLEKWCNCQCCQKSDSMKEYERLRVYTIGWVQDLVKSQHELYYQLNRLVQNQFTLYDEINKFFVNIRENDRAIKSRNLMERLALRNRLVAQNIMKQTGTRNQSE